MKRSVTKGIAEAHHTITQQRHLSCGEVRELLDNYYSHPTFVNDALKLLDAAFMFGFSVGYRQGKAETKHA